MYTTHVKHLTEYHCDKCPYITVTLQDIQRHCVEDHKREYYLVIPSKKLTFLLEESQFHCHAYDMDEEERKEAWKGPGWYAISPRTPGTIHSLQHTIDELHADVARIQQDIATLTAFREQRPKG